jgi:hypothetical protein
MFTRQSIIIPAAGTVLEVPITGLAVDIESMPVYTVPEQVPLIVFDNPDGARQPIYPQSTYTAQEAKQFRRFFIEGTTESAGDTIWLLVSDVCMPQRINTNTQDLLTPYPGPTKTFTATSVAQAFVPSDYILNGKFPVAMYVMANYPSNNTIRFAFGVIPTSSSGYQLGYDSATAVREIYKFTGINFITDFQFIRQGASNADFYVTFEY